MARPLRRITRHVELAARLGWPAFLLGLGGSALLAALLPVTGDWIVLLVALIAATAGVALAAFASRSDEWTPADGAETVTLLESATAADQAAHVLLRAGILLMAFFVGVRLTLAVGLGA